MQDDDVGVCVVLLAREGVNPDDGADRP